jgi:UDP-N-acetylmuramyl pentapeptide phosphotransferase/UDP-N-acetylglucosamine-1-phosphate transferase
LKKLVNEWEFWVVVALLIVVLYALFLAYQAAEQGINWAENTVQNLPANVAGAAGSAAGGFISSVAALFGLSGNSNATNATQGSNDQSYQGAGSGSGNGGS